MDTHTTTTLLPAKSKVLVSSAPRKLTEVRKLLRLSLRPAEAGSLDLRKAAVSVVTAGTSQHGESA